MADDALKLLAKGQNHLAKGENDKAYKAFVKATKTDENLAEAYFLTAEAAVAVPKVKVEDIDAAYAKAVELEGENPRFLATYGAFLLDTGQWSKAEEFYNRAAEADAGNPGWYYQEFGFEYFQAMNRHYEGQLNAGMLKEVRKKAAQYMLKAIGLEPDDAKDLW